MKQLLKYVRPSVPHWILSAVAAQADSQEETQRPLILKGLGSPLNGRSMASGLEKVGMHCEAESHLGIHINQSTEYVAMQVITENIEALGLYP